MGMTPAPGFNLNPGGGSSNPPGMPTFGNFDLSSSTPQFSFSGPFPTGPAPASPSPNIPVNTNPQAGGGTTPYTTDVGGGYRAGSTLNPQFSGTLTNFLNQSLLSGGANPYTGQLSSDPNQNELLSQLGRLLQGQGSSLPGAGNLQNIAGGMGPGILNQLAQGMGLGSIPGMSGGQGFGSLNQLAQGQGPGMGTLNQLSQTGAPVDQTPAWQAMVDAMQRQIGQGATNLKEQFNFAGNLAGSPFANSMQDYFTQSNKDLNAQLLAAQTGSMENAAQRRLGASQALSSTALSGSDILSQLGLGASNTLQNSALNSALGLGGLTSGVGMGLMNSSGNLGQYAQGLGDTALQRQYQDWLRQQPQYNPLLPMMQQLGTTFAPFLNTNQGQSPLNALIGSLPSLINSVHPTSLNFNPSYNPTVTASGGAGGQGGAGGTSTSTAQGGAGGTATASPTIDPSMNPTFQNVPSFDVSPTFSPSVDPSFQVSPTIAPSINPSILGTISPTFQNTPSFQNNPSVQVSPTTTNTVNPYIAPQINPSISPTMINTMSGGGLPSGFPGQPSPIPPPPGPGSIPISSFPFPPTPSPGGTSTGSTIGFPGGPQGPSGVGSAPPPPPGGYGNMPIDPGAFLNPNFGPGMSGGFPYDPGPPSVGNFWYPAGGLPGSGVGLEGTPSTNPALNPSGWGGPYIPNGPIDPYQPSPTQAGMTPIGNDFFGANSDPWSTGGWYGDWSGGGGGGSGYGGNFDELAAMMGDY